MNNREYQKNYKASHKERIKFLNDRYRRNHREYLNFLARKNHTKNKKHRNFLRRKNYKNSGGEISKRYYEKHKENVLKLKTSFRWTEERKKKFSKWNKIRCKGKSLEEIYGKEKAKEIKEKFRKKMTGKNNPQYKHGKSKEPYPLEWNNWLREQVRRRDNKCEICGISRKKYNVLYNRDLIVHHIDRDKSNLDFFNLVSICLFCHGKIQHFQEDLIDFFHAKLLGLLD
jgi:hypothetical protein